MPKQGYFDDTGVMQTGLLWPESLLQVSRDLFSISFTQEAFMFDTPKIADGLQIKTLLQKRTATFFSYKMQMHFQHGAMMI